MHLDNPAVSCCKTAVMRICGEASELHAWAAVGEQWCVGAETPRRFDGGVYQRLGYAMRAEITLLE